MEKQEVVFNKEKHDFLLRMNAEFLEKFLIEGDRNAEFILALWQSLLSLSIHMNYSKEEVLDIASVAYDDLKSDYDEFKTNKLKQKGKK